MTPPSHEEREERALWSCDSPELRRESLDRWRVPFGVLFLVLSGVVWQATSTLWRGAGELYGGEGGLLTTGAAAVLYPVAVLVAVAGVFVLLVGLAFLLDGVWPLSFQQARVTVTASALGWAHETRDDKGSSRREQASIARGEITSGRVQRVAVQKVAQPGVVLLLDGGDQLAIALESEAEAAELLSALGLGAGQHAATFTLLNGPLRRVSQALGAVSAVSLLAGAALAFGGRATEQAASTMAASLALRAPGWGALVLASLVLWAIAAHLSTRARSASVRVGVDGLGGAVPARFVRWADVVSMERRGDREVQITTKSGAFTVALEARSEPEVDAMLTRCLQARAAFTAEPPRTDELELERHERPTSVWLASLSRGADAGPYRQGDDDAAVVGVLTHPMSSAEQRVGAAVALMTRSASYGPQIASAAASLAEPLAIEALGAAVAGDLERALGVVVEG